MISENGTQTHGPRMENCFMAKTTQACVAMYNLDTFSNDDISKDWKEGKDGGHG